jgi:hypothetical protein
MESVTPPLLSPPRRQRFALFLKIGGIGFLILLLHVPLAMTDGVLRERSQYRDEAVSQIASVWGGRQTVTGPILAVPYTYRGHVTRTKMVNGNAVQVDEAASITGTAFEFPAGTPQVFLHGEATFVRDLRRLLYIERQIPRSGQSISGYWRIGHDEDRWQSTKREWNESVEREQDGPK